MRLATPSQIVEIEKRTNSEFKISPEILMENAGSAAAREIFTSFLPELQRGRVAILSGPGNNGADALACARHLTDLGVGSVEIICVGEGASQLYKLQHERATKQKLNIKTFQSLNDIKDFDIYVDGLFGVGLNRDLEEPYLSIIEYLNSKTCPIVSLDLPSGLDGLTGNSRGGIVRASLTLTFGVGKVGLYTSAGAEFSGRVRVVPIGLPRSLISEIAATHFFINEKWVRPKIPLRKKSGNKFDNGRLYILAGHPGTWGAAALCCQGAYRIGAGHVTLVTESKAEADKYLGKDLGPEVLLTTSDDPEIFEKADAIIVGPGAGKTQNTEDFILKLLSLKVPKVVIDADGLRMLSKIKNIKLLPSWILTPHSGELSDLINVSSQEIEKNRIISVKRASDKWGCHILLKGFRSIIAAPDGRTFIIGAGNSALSKAGTGDVLSGFIGTLLGQGLNALTAAGVGAFIHGRLADQWVKNGGNNSTLMASDLPLLISEELNRLERV